MAGRARAAAQAGVMLIEVLIAILIFSMGVLAIVQLQALSVKQSADAEYRSQAALLASDLVSRMWGTDRALATLQNQFASSVNGDGYKAWYETVKRSGLPKASDEAYQPDVEILADPKLKDAARATITVYWEVRDDEEKDPKQDRRHEYVTVVVLKP